ncbi:MAG: hypothetical protein ACD_28C00192G0008 [uncultured bacterium]|nr:MAG: hypothetical protein ACD_28C00192G0008 [uncultured bacterium]
MSDPDKNKEMDLLLCKVDRREEDGTPKIKSIVVEIKHPSINVGTKEYTQLSKYRDVISKEPRFNGDSFEWRFFLVGKKHDSFIDGQLASNR